MSRLFELERQVNSFKENKPKTSAQRSSFDRNSSAIEAAISEQQSRFARSFAALENLQEDDKKFIKFFETLKPHCKNRWKRIYEGYAGKKYFLGSYKRIIGDMSTINQTTSESYHASISPDQIIKLANTMGKWELRNPTEEEKKKYLDDIYIPQCKFAVAKQGEGGLITTGITTCTGIALLAKDKNNKAIYALGHFDADPHGLNNVKDMQNPTKFVRAMVEAVRTAGGQKNIQLGLTCPTRKPKNWTPGDSSFERVIKAIHTLQSENQELQVIYAAQKPAIRVGDGPSNISLVFPENLYGNFEKSSIDHLRKQLNAMKIMHESIGKIGKWGNEMPEHAENYSNMQPHFHDPFEGVLEAMYRSMLLLVEKRWLHDIKKMLREHQTWIKRYGMGRRILNEFKVFFKPT